MELFKLNQKIYLLIFSFKLGICLECFICHSRQGLECGDPFPKGGNLTGNVIPYDCMKVREIGLGAIAVSSAMAQLPSSFQPLSPPPHVCYKISVGDLAIRGCGRADVCQNYTDLCEVCDSYACNSSPRKNRSLTTIFLSAVAAIMLRRKLNTNN